MARIGLLGGSFNPPHVCHVRLTELALERGLADEVWWLPVHRHAFDKDRSLAPWEDRLAMAEAALAGLADSRVRVDPVEATLGPRSYTIETIAALRERHPEHTFVWIAGADVLRELPRWHRWDELKAMLAFAVVGRGERRAEVPAGASVELLDVTLPDISSSQVRRLIAAGEREAARPLLPPAVAAWLDDHPDVYA